MNENCLSLVWKPAVWFLWMNCCHVCCYCCCYWCWWVYMWASCPWPSIALQVQNRGLKTNCIHFSLRDIASENFVMHEVHCRRNIALCTHCQEPVARAEMDNHYEEYHASIQCEKCKASMEKTQLESHQVSNTFSFFMFFPSMHFLKR